MKLILGIIFLTNVTITGYQSVPRQTDSSPLYTSTGERVNKYGCAISRDLLCPDCMKLHKRCLNPVSDKIHYGDMLYIEDVGFKFVNDVMGRTKWDGFRKRRVEINQGIDLWCPSPQAESRVWHDLRGKKAVWVIRGNKEQYELQNMQRRNQRQ